MSKKTISELFSLSGKTAIVTGGAMGIGYGIVKRLVEAGAKTVIADIAVKAGEAKAKAFQKQGKSVSFIKADVSSERDVKNLISKSASTTVQTYQRICLFLTIVLFSSYSC